MNDEIQIQESESELKPRSDLSPGKARQRYKQANKDLQTSILFGYKRQMLLALTLADVRLHRLYVIDGIKSFLGYAEDIGVSPSSAKYYAQIGEMLREAVKRHRGLKESPEVLTVKDVFAVLDQMIKFPSEIKLKGLREAAQSYDAFEKYLSGESKEAPAQKLLGKVRKQSDAPKVDGGTNIDEIETRIASEHGFDRKDGIIVHRDGTPLTPREECLFISPSSAIRPAEDLEAALLKAIEITERSVKSFGDSFWKYREHGNDEPFQHAWKQKMALAKKRLQQLETQFQWIYNGPTEQEGVE